MQNCHCPEHFLNPLRGFASWQLFTGWLKQTQKLPTGLEVSYIDTPFGSNVIAPFGKLRDLAGLARKVVGAPSKQLGWQESYASPKGAQSEVGRSG